MNETFEPIWIRSPDARYWIYSLNSPQQVTVQCQEVGSPPTAKTSYQLLLQGTGILPNPSCYIHAESFKLLPHSLGRTTVTLSIAHIVLPSVENILYVSEENMLQPNLVQTTHLERLDEILERATSRSLTRGFDVNKIVNTLRKEDVPQPPVHLSWIIGIVIIFLSLGILWTTWSKFTTRCCICTKKYTSQRNLHFETATDLKLNQYPVGLQVNLEGEGMEEKQEDSALNSTSPTVFSRPGVMIADHP